MRQLLQIGLISIVLVRGGFAQDSGLGGVITDPAGQAVSGANITLLNQSTGFQREAKTTDGGVYGFYGLTPGQYRVSISKTGFEPVVREQIQVQVGATQRFDAALQIQGASQSVEIAEDVPLLDADRPSLATEVSSRQYDQLPLVQQGRIRSPVAFVNLAPSVLGGIQLTGAENTSATNYIQVNGSQTQTTELYLDGVQAGRSRPLRQGSYNENAPAVDAIREFRFISTLLPADYGKSGAAVGTFSMKSGSNRLHGSLYEYLRNNALDAQPWGSATRLFTRQNEFGGTAGGPVRIPRVYNGANRTFFFFSYGGSRKRGADAVQLLKIPTPAQIAGNFSGFSTIYDPASTTLDSTGTRYTRTPFPNNIVPARSIDPVAAAVAKYYPAPNLSGARNYSGYSGEKLLDIDAEAARFDHQLDERNQITASFVFTYLPRIVVQTALPAPLIGGQNQPARTNTAQTHWITTPSAHFVNRFSVAMNRYVSPSAPIDNAAVAPLAIGLKGIDSTAPPTITFANSYATVSQNTLQYQTENTFILRDVAYLTIRSHQLRFGGEYRVSQYNDYTPTPASSTLSISNLETALPTSTSNTGDAFASFLLGQVDAATQALPVGLANRQKYAGFFVQDDWKLLPHLTMNLGFRWEFQMPPFEKVGRNSIVSLTTPNPAAGNLPGALLFGGKGNGTSAFGANDFSGIGPRIGLAWQLQPKTVLRGGYGIYYSDLGLTLITAGFQPQASYATPNAGITPAFTLASGFPASQSLTLVQSPSLLNGQNASFYGSNATAMPRLQEWTVSLQRELGHNLLVEATYVGNKGTRLLDSQLSNINQLDPSKLSLGSLLTQNITSAAAVAAGIRAPYPGFTGTVAQALRPYPQYNTLTEIGAKRGASSYQAFQAVVKKRFSNGLSIDGSYVFSRFLGYNSPSATLPGAIDNVLQNAYDSKSEWALMPSDVKHALVINYVYELPFHYTRSRVIEQLISGWSIAAIHRYQSGFPLSILTTNSLPIFNRVLRPNQAADVDPATHISIGDFKLGYSTVINKAAFSAPTPFTFGTASPTDNRLRSFPVLNEDLTLTRRVKFPKGISLTLYGQFFNLLNRHRFTSIDTNFSSSTFGQPGGVSQPRFVQVGARMQF